MLRSSLKWIGWPPLLSLPIALFFVVGASIIDKETKEGVQETKAGVQATQAGIQETKAGIQQTQEGIRQTQERIQNIEDRLVELVRNQQTQNALLLKTITDLKTTGQQSNTAVLKGLQSLFQKIDVIPPPVNAPASPPMNASVNLDRVEKRFKNVESLIQIALLLVVIGLLCLIGLFVSVRRTEQRIKKDFWQVELDSLQSGPPPLEPHSRPQIKVETHHSRLSLINIGQTAASDIKLYVGPAPSTLRQRQKAVGHIPAGEKTEIDISHQLPADHLFGGLEYRNPYTGKIYKDNFVLRLDPASGEFFPEGLTA